MRFLLEKERRQKRRNLTWMSKLKAFCFDLFFFLLFSFKYRPVGSISISSSIIAFLRKTIPCDRQLAVASSISVKWGGRRSFCCRFIYAQFFKPLFCPIDFFFLGVHFFYICSIASFFVWNEKGEKNYYSCLRVAFKHPGILGFFVPPHPCLFCKIN